MALFKNDPPEKGVSKLEKRGFFNCASIALRSLGTLVRANLLFCLTVAPLFALCVLIAFIVFPDTDILHTGFKVDYVFQVMLIPLPLGLCGPMVAGLTKITRDVGRGEHVFVVKDFFATFKRCFLKSLIVSLIAYAFYVAASFSFIVYWGSWVLFGVAAIATMYFTIMLKYIFLMTVSLKLSVFKMFKNAFFLILVSFKNSGIALLAMIISQAFLFAYVLMTLYVNVAVVFLATAVLLIQFALPDLFINYYCFDVIIKQVVEPYYEENKSNDISADSACDIKTKGEKYADDTPREQSDYVYENGRLVKKSVHESERIFNDDAD